MEFEIQHKDLYDIQKVVRTYRKNRRIYRESLKIVWVPVPISSHNYRANVEYTHGCLISIPKLKKLNIFEKVYKLIKNNVLDTDSIPYPEFEYVRVPYNYNIIRVIMYKGVIL